MSTSLGGLRPSTCSGRGPCWHAVVHRNLERGRRCNAMLHGQGEVMRSPAGEQQGTRKNEKKEQKEERGRVKTKCQLVKYRLVASQAF